MDTEIKNALLAILILNLFGIIAYHYLEHWNWVDSLYFSSATLTTVGYGDITPKSEIGRIFTIFYMWSGVSIGFYTLTLLSRQQGNNLQKRMNQLKSLESHLTNFVRGKKKPAASSGRKKFKIKFLKYKRV